ncbi:MAG TPA: ABC transporter ATP-binding protein [Chitinophagaceae bacterium]|nr:ABC transporter ATP-binding protein [Chitinophagaceae bacterium]
MKVSLTDAGKRYNRDWIFRHVTYEFEAGKSYAITGPNGSGKSTLLQALSGGMLLSEGSIRFGEDSRDIPAEAIFPQVSICAPYLEVIEEMTLRELLDFHGRFKPYLPGLGPGDIIARLGLEHAAEKQIRYYSSGMRQRVKLAQAIFSDTRILLLDEPCTNLDAPGIELYHRLIDDFGRDRVLIVSSNDEVEYRFCQHRISLTDYKR